MSLRSLLYVFFLHLCVLSFPLVSFANTNLKVEEEVKKFFEDVPVMVEIARCESKLRQFDTSGLPLRGGWGGNMIGVFQVYESIHSSTALLLGFDLNTLEGNLAYAKHLYKTSGTSPWNSSRACWEKVSVTPKTVYSKAEIAALEKKIVKLKKLLAQLQILLAEKNKTT